MFFEEKIAGHVCKSNKLELAIHYAYSE